MKLELGVTGEEPEVEFEERELGPLNWVSRVRRWWRLNVGGFLWVVVGAYLLWRLLNVMAGVYSSSDVVIDKPVWPDTRNIFVLYGILIPGKTSLTRTSGDSLSQTGYNPFGEHPSISNPLGNPPYPGWTTSAGPNWVSTLSIGHLTVGRLSHYRTQSFYRHGPRLCDKWVYRHILEGRSESTILPPRSQETILCSMDRQRHYLLYYAF